MKNNDNVAMTQRMRWLNRSIATINTTFQLLDIYRFVNNKFIITKANYKLNTHINYNYSI